LIKEKKGLYAVIEGQLSKCGEDKLKDNYEKKEQFVRGRVCRRYDWKSIISIVLLEEMVF
jgi:hypothetical protein